MSKQPKSEVMVANPKLQKDLEIIQSLQIQVDEIGTQLLQIKVMDDSTLSICQQNLSKVNSVVKTIEEKRVILKAPYLEAGKQIDALCKSITDLATKGITHAKSEIANWERQRLAIAAEAQAKIDAQAKEVEQKRVAEEARKQEILTFISTSLKPYLQSTYEGLKSVEDCDKFLTYIDQKFPGVDKFQEYFEDANQIKDNYIDLINSKKSQFGSAANISEAEKILLLDKEALILAKQQLAQRELEIKQREDIARAEKERKEAEELAELEKAKIQAAADLEKTKGVRYIWKFEVVDINNVPKEWLCLDESKVKEYLKANKDMKEGTVNGVTFFKTSSVVA